MKKKVYNSIYSKKLNITFGIKRTGGLEIAIHLYFLAFQKGILKDNQEMVIYTRWRAGHRN